MPVTSDRVNVVNVPFYEALPKPPHEHGKIEITVCVPLYRRAPIIEESLKTILEQKYPRDAYEVIFVDDMSGDNTRKVLEDIFERYPEWNMRAYFREKTTTFNDVAPFNIMFRLAKGWIVILNQIDIKHKGEVLEATWRHHNALPNLWLCPKHYGENPDGSLAEWPPQFWPHEFGSSIRKHWLFLVKGRNENILYGPPDVEFHWRLNGAGIVFAEDPSIQTVHRWAVHTWNRKARQYPSFEIPKVEWRVPWTESDQWGILTESEKQSVIMTEAVKNA